MNDHLPGTAQLITLSSDQDSNLTQQSMTRNVIFIGCGKVATGAASLLQQQGVDVHGVRRDISALPSSMQKTSADVSDPTSLNFLKSTTADTLVYSLAASEFNEKSYTAAYITGLQNVITACDFTHIKRLIFVSSTAVYHQNDGSVVDEQSATEPTRFNGKLMLEAEHLALSTGIGTALRFSGIYGPGRNRMIERVRTGNCTQEHSAAYTNRIHSEDCSAALVHLIMQTELPPLILGTDSKPARSTDVESFIAEKLGVEKQYVDPGSNLKTKVRRIAGSKQCCNRLLLNTGFAFRYPSYKEGYQKLINDYGNSL